MLCVGYLFLIDARVNFEKYIDIISENLEESVLKWIQTKFYPRRQSINQRNGSIINENRQTF